MNSWLLALTFASIAAAGGFGWFAWHLHDQERRRSAARVAALASAIDGRADQNPVAVNDLFAPEHSAAAHGVPVIRLAVGVAMVLILLVAVSLSTRDTAGDRSAETLRPIAGNAPLELMSMRHERQGDRLTVSGLVRNPRGGESVADVTAVLFAFNRAGAFVTSARASLDFPKLAAGDESPFVVTIPGVADVGRYRVSFRTAAGVVQHIDRRAEQMRLASAGR
jgi:hypothetical protein